MFEPTFIPACQVGQIALFSGPLLTGAQLVPSTHFSWPRKIAEIFDSHLRASREIGLTPRGEV